MQLTRHRERIAGPQPRPLVATLQQLIQSILASETHDTAADTAVFSRRHSNCHAAADRRGSLASVEVHLNARHMPSVVRRNASLSGPSRIAIRTATAARGRKVERLIRSTGLALRGHRATTLIPISTSPSAT